jgi:endonuclease/exonuclease/phosphatase family metal-dependent hydrolase
VTAVRIATFNVHGCRGRDGRRDPVRVARVLERLDAVVIGLQEVDSRGHANPHSGQLVELAEGVGMEAVAGETMTHPSGNYGNALLTDLPIVSVTRHELSQPGREPRGALVVTLDVSGVQLGVVVTHLGLTRRERSMQLERLEAICRSIEGSLVVVGDFNEWSQGRLRRTSFGAGNARGPNTFPSVWPLLPLDGIFVRAPDRVERLVVADGGKPSASDHLPLVADVTLSSS